MKNEGKAKKPWTEFEGKKLPLLPPCRVCGEKASGLHYGVNTCEACKAFFRRSLQRGKKYKCHEGDSCEVRASRRNRCSSCRLKKCMALGMCREAIKTGRYTHEKKINDIMEIKNISMVENNSAKLQENTLENNNNFFTISNASIEPTNTFKKYDDPNESYDDFENIFELAQNSFQPYPPQQANSSEGQFEFNQQSENVDFFQNICKQNLLRANFDFNNSEEGFFSFDDPTITNMSTERTSYDDLNPFMKDLEDSFQDSLSYLNLDNVNPKVTFDDSQNLSLNISNLPASPLTTSSAFVASYSSPSTFLSNDSLSPPSLYTNSSYEMTPQSLSSSQPFVPDITTSTAPVLPEPQTVSSTGIENYSSSFDNFSVVPKITLKPDLQFPSGTLSDQELQEIVDKISLTRLKNSRWKEDFYERLPSIHQEYLERKKLHTEVFGSLKPLSMDEYSMIYMSTGIDVDGRKEYMMNELPHFELAVRRFITFAKIIPGFNCLSIEDQICLIKNSKFEAWMLFAHRLFNTEHMLYVEQSGRVVSADDMKKVNNSCLVEGIFRLQSKLQALKLSHEEICIMAALCVMSCDTSDLEKPYQVHKYQDLMLQCLLYLFKKYHPEDRLRFAKFTNCLLQMRTMKLVCQKEEDFVVKWEPLLEIPKLVYEVWSS